MIFKIIEIILGYVIVIIGGYWFVSKICKSLDLQKVKESGVQKD